MNGHWLHLSINHFPIVLSIVGALAALVAFVTRRRAALLYALVTMVAAGLTSYPAQFTGEYAEEAVEHRWYVDESAIHAHEEAGERATWILIAGGVAAAIGMYVVLRAPREATPSALLLTLMLVLSVSGAVAAGYTGWQGGKIVSRNERLGAGSAPSDSASLHDHSGH